MDEDTDLTSAQASRIEKAKALTKAQFQAASDIVRENYGGVPADKTFPILAALVQAMATNYAAYVPTTRAAK